MDQFQSEVAFSFFTKESDITDVSADVILNGEGEMTVRLKHAKSGWMHITLCVHGRSQAVRIVILRPEGNWYLGTIEAPSDWFYLRDKVLDFRLKVD